jgi:hypothetical protein
MSIKVIAVIAVSIVVLAVVKIDAISEYLNYLLIDYLNSVK